WRRTGGTREGSWRVPFQHSPASIGDFDLHPRVLAADIAHPPALHDERHGAGDGLVGGRFEDREASCLCERAQHINLIALLLTSHVRQRVEATDVHPAHRAFSSLVAAAVAYSPSISMSRTSIRNCPGSAGRLCACSFAAALR